MKYMNNVTSWPKDTVPQALLDEMLDFYRHQVPYDPHFKGTDLRGIPPQYNDIPALYDFLNSLGYEFEDINCSGNYLETASNYPIHVDTGKSPNCHFDSTVFLFPLSLPENCNSYLFILNQQWTGEATTFVRQPWLVGWNHVCNDYSDSRLINLETSKWDNRFSSFNIPFTADTLEGMSIDSIYKWKIGSFASFPCNRLHFGITDSTIPKIGLSLRLRCKR